MLSSAKATPRGEYCCGVTWGSGCVGVFCSHYYIILHHYPDLWLIDIILVPTHLSALHSDDLGGRCGPLKTQYLGARGAGWDWLELELD